MKAKESKFVKGSYAKIRLIRDYRLFSKEFKGAIFLMATNIKDNPDSVIAIGTNCVYPAEIKGGVIKVLDFYPGHYTQIPIFKEGYKGDRCSRTYDDLLDYLNGNVEKVMTYDEYCKDDGTKTLTPNFFFKKAENKSGFQYVRLKKVSIVGEVGINDDLLWDIKPGVSQLIVVFPFSEGTIFHLTDSIYFQADNEYYFNITSSGIQFVKCLKITSSVEE